MIYPITMGTFRYPQRQAKAVKFGKDTITTEEAITDLLPAHFRGRFESAQRQINTQLINLSYEIRKPEERVQVNKDTGLHPYSQSGTVKKLALFEEDVIETLNSEWQRRLLEVLQGTKNHKDIEQYIHLLESVVGMGEFMRESVQDVPTHLKDLSNMLDLDTKRGRGLKSLYDGVYKDILDSVLLKHDRKIKWVNAPE